MAFRHFTADFCRLIMDWRLFPSAREPFIAACGRFTTSFLLILAALRRLTAAFLRVLSYCDQFTPTFCRFPAAFRGIIRVFYQARGLCLHVIIVESYRQTSIRLRQSAN
jgi:hypothetical protein